MTCPSVLNNSDKLIAQDKRGNIKTLLDGINEVIQRLLLTPACKLQEQMDVDLAVGQFLDYIGARINQIRSQIAADNVSFFGFQGNGLGWDQHPFYAGNGSIVAISDTLYRQYLKARGGQLQTTGTVPNMDAIIQSALGAGHYIDNFDMTCFVRIDQALETWEIEQLVETGLITKPAGVRIVLIVSTDEGNFFGFQGNGVGWDQSPFANVFAP